MRRARGLRRSTWSVVADMHTFMHILWVCFIFIGGYFLHPSLLMIQITIRKWHQLSVYPLAQSRKSVIKIVFLINFRTIIKQLVGIDEVEFCSRLFLENLWGSVYVGSYEYCLWNWLIIISSFFLSSIICRSIIDMWSIMLVEHEIGIFYRYKK